MLVIYNYLGMRSKCDSFIQSLHKVDRKKNNMMASISKAMFVVKFIVLYIHFL